MQKMIVISGGGTGGHLAIAKALMLECQKRKVKCIYIGSISKQDRLWFENESGFENVYFLQTTGIVNQRGIGIFKSIFKQVKAFFQAKKILQKYSASCVFSVGGYSAGPASFAAIFLRIPLFIHEQNSIKGTLNRLLSPFASLVFGSFKHQSANFLLTSYPVRDEFFQKARVRKEIKCVLFLGGSQGAVAINDFALKIAPILHKKNIKILHQSGEKDFKRLQDAYRELNLEVELFAFSRDLVSLMSEADLCFTRSGASSLWEMCANTLPCVFIPYPYASNAHQEHNASFLTKDGMGILCLQQDLKEDLLEQVFKMDLAKVSEGLAKKIKQGGAGEILDHILSRVDDGR